MKDMKRSTSPTMRSLHCRAEVLVCEGEDDVLVRLDTARPEEVQPASLAVIGYSARVGDRVLVAVADGVLHVVGVLGDARRRQLPTESSLTLRAAERIVIEAPEVLVRAGHLAVDAESVCEQADTTYRRANEAHASFARSRTKVAGDCEVLAGSATIVSSGDTKIDGQRVLLG